MTSPGLNAVAWHFAAGTAFLTGGAVLMAAAAASFLWPVRWVRFPVRIAAAAGLLAVLLSAAPLPGWAVSALAVMVPAWLIVQEFAGTGRAATVARGLVITMVAGSALAELPHWALPHVPIGEAEAVYVIGDSLSAGVGRETTWPQMLAGMQDLPVVNAALAGATARSAWTQAARVGEGPSLVIVLIGGNDLLGGTPAAEFEQGLRGLLERLGGRDRTLVMFELPLPPLHGGYGRVQRRLARESGAVLVPRRVLARVMSRPENTLDGVHLSEHGHRDLAAAVAAQLER